MSVSVILFVIFGTSVVCYGLERKVAWVGHVSSVCMIILAAFILSALNLMPKSHHVYDVFLSDCVPIALVLMVIGLDLTEVIKLPKHLITLFAMGSLGTLTGSFIAGKLAYKEMGENGYKIAAQLAASYIGGGENAVAMKEIINIPNDLFVTVFAVDNLVTSLWIVLTILLGRTTTTNLYEMEDKSNRDDGFRIEIIDILLSIFLAFGVVLLSGLLSKYIGFMHKVLYLSIIALAIGQVPAIRNRIRPAYLLGTILFCGFFYSIGAISDIDKIIGLPKMTILMPFIIVFVHGIFIILTTMLLKIGSIEMSVVSQTLIGGPATAVAVAQTKGWRVGISVGLVLGVLGYAIGTFLGSFVYSLLLF